MKKFSRRRAQKKNVKGLLGATALVITTGLAILAWIKKTSIKSRAKSFKNEAIKNAYFDTLTQKDVAWG